jgi:hypothetical protein
MTNGSPDKSVLSYCRALGPFVQGTPDACLSVSVPTEKLKCSATLIGPNLVLTASHCVCVQPSMWPANLESLGITGIQAKIAHLHPGKICSNTFGEGASAHDIALLTLTAPVLAGPSTYLAPYTQGDFPARFAAGDFTSLRMWGYGEPNLGHGQKALVDPARFTSFDGIIDITGAAAVFGQKGDSGGPLTVKEGGITRVTGVMSTFNASTDTIYAPTWDTEPFDPAKPASDMPNGEWLRRKLAEIDPDGDGVSDDVDNCPASASCAASAAGCANADQTDTDHDGKGNVCDLDDDNDGVLDTKDNCPLAANANQLDSDGDDQGDACDADDDNDGVPDSADNCDVQANADQADVDGDSIGDACDPCNDLDPDLDGDGFIDSCPQDKCPCSGSPEDADGDLVCDICNPGLGAFCQTYCATTALDNCVSVANADQHNCNADAEVARGAATVGDACDPVPCPAFQTAPGETTVVSTNISPLGPNSFKTTTIEKVWANHLDISPRGSRSTGAPGTKPAGTEASVVVDNTSYRYCVNGVNDVKCNSSALVADHFLTDAPNRATETLDSKWYRISLEDGPGPDQTEKQLSYATGSMLGHDWDAKADFAYWAAPGNWGEGLVGLPGLPGQGNGRLWISGDSKVGTTNLGKGTGFHPKAGAPQQASEQLANHYEPVQLIEFRKSSSYLGATKFPDYKPRLLARGCLSCPRPEVASPVLDEGPWAGPLRPGYGLRTGQAQIVVSVDADPGQFGVLLPNGKLGDATEGLGSGLKEQLASVTIWASQVEPMSTLGRGQAHPGAVGLAPNGTAVTEQVFMVNGSLLAKSDLRGPRGGFLVAEANALDAEAPLPLGPSPRANFLPIYSRAAGLALVVGGEVPSTGMPVGDVWMQVVDTGVWTRVPAAGYTPRHVLAATYSFADHTLWVLDSSKKGAGGQISLTRLDPITGEKHTIGTWPKLGLFDQHWLLIDRDQGVLLVASSSLLHQHVVLKLQAKGNGASLEGVRMAPHSLAFAPVVDEAGYWFVVRKPGAKTPVLVERLETLDLKRGPWSKLGACL